MNPLGDISRRDLFIAGVAFVLSLALAFIPPVTIGGFMIWFYLVPGLIACYSIPPRLLIFLVFGTSAVLLVSLPFSSPTALAQIAAYDILILGLALWRQQTGRVDILLVAITLLLGVCFPFLVVVSYLLAEVSLQQALFISARFLIGAVLSVLLAEAIVLFVTLTRRQGFLILRDALGFRPPLVQVVELIIGAAVAISLVITLTLFWRSWDNSLSDVLRTGADLRLNNVFAAAESSTREKMTLATLMTDQLLAEGALADEKLISVVSQFLDESDDRDGEISVSLLGLSIGFSGREMMVSDGLSASAAERGFALARAQVASGLVSLDLRLSDGQVRPAYALISANQLPDLLVVFENMADAIAFTYRFDAAFDDSDSDYAELPVFVPATVGIYEPNSYYNLPANAQLLEMNDRGWAIWNPARTDRPRLLLRDFATSVNEATRVSFSPADNSLDRFSRSIQGVDRFRLNMNFWPFYSVYAEAMSLSSILGTAVLAVLLLLSRMVVSTMIRPLSELTTVFESWRQFRGGELGSGAALQAMDAKGFSSLQDIHSLQVGFRSLAQDVMYGERRLSTIAANYDELLRSLPLGVLAVDGSSRVQFLNDALGEITEQRQDAISRLKTHAANMLSAGITVDEWQLNLEDRPPKSLLMVVNHRLDDRGQESGLWAIATDLTEQKQTNAQLIQASKLATLGEMSTGMAHELNQPLNVISLATSNLRFSVKKGKATEDNTMSKLDRIDGAVHRAASIIDHMRAFGRLAGEGLTEINVGEIVQGACNLLSEQLKLANINLINQLTLEGVSVKGNAIQLEQVLINLINNARDAIREGDGPGEVVVDSEISENRVLIKVTDTGGGIPENALPHVFEPFFTTKPVGKGTGLGGSISYGIVREMQGDIWAENVPGGAQITISLPLLRRTAGQFDAVGSEVMNK